MAEPIVILQPSLHGSYEFVECVLKIALDLGVSEASQLLIEHTEDSPHEDEIFRECCEALSDAGYANVCQDDTFLVWDEGVPIPKEWQQ